MAICLSRTGLSRRTVFGYTCARCLTCCRFKTIQINPYEVARLARHRGISTTEFIEAFTEKGGTVLQSKPDGTCIFLDHKGCGVHPDRPLVCRLYPLGRHRGFSGEERFSQIEPEQGCRGQYHENGNVEQYLEEQRAFPFMRAADLYLELLQRLMGQLTEGVSDSGEFKTILDTVNTGLHQTDSYGGLPWTDMDRVLADYCERSGHSIPERLEDKTTHHIKAVLSWAEFR